IQTSGCTGQNTCNFVQGIHTQLPIFQDPGLTRPATVPTVDQLVNLSQLNNKTMPEMIAANTYGQVFTYIDTQSLGVQYSANTRPLQSDPRRMHRSERTVQRPTRTDRAADRH